MKTLIALIMVLTLNTWTAEAGTVRDMMLNDPEQLEQKIEKGNYSDLLTFVNNAYTESQSETDGLTQYAYLAVLAKASSDKQVRLAIDFSLTKSDLSLKALGAETITNAVLNGTTISSTQQEQAKAKLKSELQALSRKGQAAYDFAQNAASALIVLSDDAGLDVFLTDTKMVRSYSLKDNWTSTSPVSLFQTLKDNYTSQVTASGKNWDKIMAATYELCRARRAGSIEVKPIRPLANLQNLLQ